MTAASFSGVSPPREIGRQGIKRRPHGFSAHVYAQSPTVPIERAVEEKFEAEIKSLL